MSIRNRTSVFLSLLETNHESQPILSHTRSPEEYEKEVDLPFRASEENSTLNRKTKGIQRRKRLFSAQITTVTALCFRKKNVLTLDATMLIIVG